MYCKWILLYSLNKCLQIWLTSYVSFKGLKLETNRLIIIVFCLLSFVLLKLSYSFGTIPNYTGWTGTECTSRNTKFQKKVVSRIPFTGSHWEQNEQNTIPVTLKTKRTEKNMHSRNGRRAVRIVHHYEKGVL